MNCTAPRHQVCGCKNAVRLARFRRGRTWNLMYTNLFFDTVIGISLPLFGPTIFYKIDPRHDGRTGNRNKFS